MNRKRLRAGRPRFDRLMRLCLGLACLLAGPLFAGDVLEDRDSGPLTGFFGIPDSREGALLLDDGRSSWAVSLSTASHSIRDARVDLNETIILDGETTRLELKWRKGIGDRAEIGLVLPFTWHESGGFDSLVQNWHDALGFPGGFRSSRPNDVIEFLYFDPDGERLNFTRNVHGIGDPRLLGAWQLAKSSTHALALRGSIKLPVGDASELLGSGGTDLSFGLAGDYLTFHGNDRLNAFYRLNAVLLGEPEWLADKYESFVGHVSLGFGYRLTDRIELRVQGAVRSATYESGIEVLGEPSGTITFGGNIRLAADYTLGIAVSEDVKVRSAPDVTFRLALTYRPDYRDNPRSDISARMR